MTREKMDKVRDALEAVVKVGYPHNFQREAYHIRSYCKEITEAIKKCHDALALLSSEAEVVSSKTETTTGNAAKLREALLEIDELTNLLDIPEDKDKKNLLFAPSHSLVAVKMRKIIKKALEEPPRNCDVGTADEQVRRYHNFTDRYNPCAYRGYARCAEDCPVRTKLAQEGHGELLCQLEWAQTPYTEGGAK